jgi:hypothetical protein
MRGFLMLALLCAAASPAVAAEPAGPLLPAGQIICGAEPDLDAYDGADPVAANLRDYPTCHRFSQQAAVIIVVRQSNHRSLIRIADGVHGGYQGWTDAKFPPQ